MSAEKNLHEHVVAVDKKNIVHMAAISVVLSTEDRQVLLDKAVYHYCRPVHSSWLFSPCSQQLVSAYGPSFHLSGLFTYPAWFSYYFGQRGPNNRGSTVLLILNYIQM